MANGSFSERVTEWMRGRNGADELGNAVVAVAVVLVILNLFVRQPVLGVIALIPACYACWRMSSTNVARRRAENRAFVQQAGPFARWLRSPLASLDETRSYKHLTCPSCQQRMRVPRGKGRMRVTCPNCHKKFETKS